MVVNFEFLGNEPIENVITCMNFRIDKVVFVGYRDAIQTYKSSTQSFLAKYCGVTEVEFCDVPQNNLQQARELLRECIEKEFSEHNEIHFDITGGESLILVAFGMLAAEYNTPVHVYDVPENRLIELDTDTEKSISRCVPVQKTELNLDRLIELRGGVINYAMHKSSKNLDSEEFVADAGRLWSVARSHWELWNPFSDFLRQHMVPNDELVVNVGEDVVKKNLQKSKTKLNTVGELNDILEELAIAGVIRNLKHSSGRYSFAFKNEAMKELVWEGGSILELRTYQQERTISDDCRVGVHIDWDGVICNSVGGDVINEVDVMALKGNVPVFISCKSGKMDSQQTLYALYELKTVAEKFGGRYARMVLVSAQPMTSANKLRAKEMNIEVKDLSD